MKNRKKFVVVIEETVSQEFEISADTPQKAMEIAADQYRKGEFILLHGEVQCKQMAIVKPENEATEWCKF